VKTRKKIETFQNGVLVSSKSIDVPDSQVKHPEALIQENAHLLKLRETFVSFEAVMKEVRQLRKQLILKENEACARLKEREALKRALNSKNDKIAHLEEKLEDFSAQLHATREDLQFFEAAAKKTISKQRKLSAPVPPIQLLDDEEDPQSTKRSIAAKPIKK
jgi:chromosome segregation ATPase